jgi:hypothetical protein
MIGQDPTEQQLEDEAIADDGDNLTVRGRPRLPQEQRRSQQLMLSFTDDEYGALLLAAAQDRKQLRKWARDLLLAIIPKV